MKAAVFYEKNKILIEELEIPSPKENEILIKVEACGICGTDIHISNGDEGAAPTPPGTVLGHEFSGTVAKTGSAVTDIHIGDRVCVDPNKLCGECFFCKSGIGHFCESIIGIGTTVNGGFAEYCCVPASQIYKVGNSLPFEAAAMAEPVSCCIHGIDMCDISCSDTVLIIGGGMIGLIMLQLAKLRGASRLILIEPVESKRNTALKLGADICIDPTFENAADVLKKHGIKRISVVIECVGKPETMKNAIELAGKKSTVMLFGLSKPNEEIGIKPFDLFKKEITLKSSYINPYTQQRAVDLISSGKLDVSTPVYGIYPLEKLPDILKNKQLLSNGKIIIKP